jgi:uncharacterized protein (DUF488 family)
LTSTEPRVRVHTLGHSRHTIERFIELAKSHGVDLIVDVRGQPFSRFDPHFNRERFKTALTAAGIGYEWRGEALSGRPKSREFYGPDGGVLWEKLQSWPALHAGLDEVLDLAHGASIALVCAEEDPLNCHRRFLLTAPLERLGAEVVHIRSDGRTETEAEVARRDKPARRRKDLFG